jgi:hypothetical protein
MFLLVKSKLLRLLVSLWLPVLVFLAAISFNWLMIISSLEHLNLARYSRINLFLKIKHKSWDFFFFFIYFFKSGHLCVGEYVVRK